MGYYLDDDFMERGLEYRRKWIDSALLTKKIDRSLVEKRLRIYYSKIHKPKPYVHWCLSPIDAYSIALENRHLGKRVYGPFSPQLVGGVGRRGDASTNWSIREAVKGLVYTDYLLHSRREMLVSFDSILRDIYSELEGAEFIPLLQLQRLFRDEMHRIAGVFHREGFQSKLKFPFQDYRAGGHPSETLDFFLFDFFSNVIDISWKLWPGSELVRVMEESSWFVDTGNILYAGERFEEINLTNGRAHCDSGPVIKFRDGSAIYSLNGVLVDKLDVMTPAEDLSVDYVLSIPNVDRRREVVKKIGINKMTEHGLVVETSGLYKLIDMAGVFRTDEFRRPNLYMPYLLMLNPSVPDTWHLEGVGRECQTVQQAINWRASNIEIDWKPYQLS